MHSARLSVRTADARSSMSSETIEVSFKIIFFYFYSLSPSFFLRFVMNTAWTPVFKVIQDM